jgi:Do/DeqQ family serine protease
MTMFRRYAGVMLLLGISVAPLHAEEKAVPQTGAQITLSFAPVVKKAAPAVVNIYIKSHVQVQDSPSPFMRDPFFQQFFAQHFHFGGRTHDQVVSSLGSGVIIKPDGMIVTSHHVIKNAQEIRVVLSDKREFDARVTLKDPQSDLAFLKIDAPDPLPFLEMRDTDTLEVGDLVLAIGNPFGVGQTVTNGIISALSRQAVGVSDYQFFIQTDAAINPGNSGGALVDMNARLVGINTAIYSKTGGSVGIGFAIPADMVRSLMNGKVEKGRVVHPWLGFSVQVITNDMAESMGMKSPQGVIVTRVSADSPADKAGFKVGDVITSFGDTPIGSGKDLQYRLALAKIGDTANMHILRDGKPETLEMALAAPPNNVDSDRRLLKGKHPLNGLTVANLSPALAAELNMDDTAVQEGVVVIATNGKSAISVLRPGDIVRAINGTEITSTEQLEDMLRTPGHKWEIAYQRNGSLNTLTVRM